MTTPAYAIVIRCKATGATFHPVYLAKRFRRAGQPIPLPVAAAMAALKRATRAAEAVAAGRVPFRDGRPLLPVKDEQQARRRLQSRLSKQRNRVLKHSTKDPRST